MVVDNIANTKLALCMCVCVCVCVCEGERESNKCNDDYHMIKYMHS